MLEEMEASMCTYLSRVRGLYIGINKDYRRTAFGLGRDLDLVDDTRSQGSNFFWFRCMYVIYRKIFVFSHS